MLAAATCASSESNAEVVVAVCSAIIAALALGTSFYFGWLQRQHFRLSSRRILDFEVGNVDEILGLYNQGVGPALIEQLTSTVDGHEIDLRSAEGLDRFVAELLVGAPPPFPDLRSRGLLQGSVLAANNGVRMVYSESVLSEEHRKWIRLNYERVVLRVKYGCIYDERFNLSHRGFG